MINKLNLKKPITIKKYMKIKKTAMQAAQKQKEEARFNEMLHKAARSVLTSMETKPVNVVVHELPEQDISQVVANYKTKLDISQNEWAPWSPYSRLVESIKRSRH